MSDEEFFRITPRQYHLLLDQHERQVQHNELLLGQICQTVANWSMHAPKTALKVKDFMPSMWSEKEPKARKQRVNHKHLEAQVRAMFASNPSVIRIPAKKPETGPEQ